jgi:hypothetical protein
MYQENDDGTKIVRRGRAIVRKSSNNESGLGTSSLNGENPMAYKRKKVSATRLSGGTRVQEDVEINDDADVEIVEENEDGTQSVRKGKAIIRQGSGTNTSNNSFLNGENPMAHRRKKLTISNSAGEVSSKEEVEVDDEEEIEIVFENTDGTQSVRRGKAIIRQGTVSSGSGRAGIDGENPMANRRRKVTATRSSGELNVNEEVEVDDSELVEIIEVNEDGTETVRRGKAIIRKDSGAYKAGNSSIDGENPMARRQKKVKATRSSGDVHEEEEVVIDDESFVEIIEENDDGTQSVHHGKAIIRHGGPLGSGKSLIDGENPMARRQKRVSSADIYEDDEYADVIDEYVEIVEINDDGTQSIHRGKAIIRQGGSYSSNSLHDGINPMARHRSLQEVDSFASINSTMSTSDETSQVQESNEQKYATGSAVIRPSESASSPSNKDGSNPLFKSSLNAASVANSPQPGQLQPPASNLIAIRVSEAAKLVSDADKKAARGKLFAAARFMKLTNAGGSDTAEANIIATMSDEQRSKRAETLVAEAVNLDPYYHNAYAFLAWLKQRATFEESDAKSETIILTIPSAKVPNAKELLLGEFEKSSSGGVQQILRVRYTEKSLYIQAVLLGSLDPAVLINLSAMLSNGERVTLKDGWRADNRALLVRAHARDPSDHLLLIQLARLISGRANVRLNSDGITRKTPVQRLKELNDSLIATVTLEDGRVMNAEQLLVEAVTNSPDDDTEALQELADVLSRRAAANGIPLISPLPPVMNETDDAMEAAANSTPIVTGMDSMNTNIAFVTLSDGSKASYSDLLIEAVARQPTCAPALVRLALLLQYRGGGAVSIEPTSNNLDVKDGNLEICTIKRLCIRAITADSTCADAYMVLADILKPGEKVELQASMTDISHTRSSASAAVAAANSSRRLSTAGQSIRKMSGVGAPPMLKLDATGVLLAAIPHAVTRAHLFYVLAMQLSPRQIVTLPGALGDASREQLLLHTLRCDGTHAGALRNLAMILNDNDHVDIGEKEPVKKSTLLARAKGRPVEGELEADMSIGGLYFTSRPEYAGNVDSEINATAAATSNKKLSRRASIVLAGAIHAKRKSGRCEIM